MSTDTVDPVSDPISSAQSVSTAANIETPLARFWAEFRESKIALVGLAGLVLIMLVALFAPLIAPQDPYDLAQVSILDSRLPPGEKSMAGYTFILGTDGAGRDLFSAILYGLRISMSVGLTSGAIAVVIGLIVGITSAYLGGRWDAVIMRIVDIQLSFPAVLIAVILLTVLGKGLTNIMIALVVAQWAYYARTVRGSALVESAKEYVEAANCLGLPHRLIMFKHILPNCLAPIIVVATVQTAHAILLEATLSFIGIGLPPTEPSLGLLISNGFEYVISGKYWISIFPGVALLITIVCINLVGDQLRDVLNPRLKR